MTPAELRQIAAKLEASEAIPPLERYNTLRTIRNLPVSGDPDVDWEFVCFVEGDPFSDTDAAIDLVRECFPDVGLYCDFYQSTKRWVAQVGEADAGGASSPSAAIMAAACRAKAEQMEQKK